MKINLLDLFSGIGGFHLGLSQAGFKVNSYYSEVDKYAIKTYNHNFKNSTYVGSVTNVRGAELPRINAITFGSPCQDFSLAGKRKGMEGSRSSLILEAIRLIEECRPDFFIWENVKGTFSSNNRQDFAAILQAFANIGGYRLEWQLLNTKWFLPQNRERIYLVGYTPNKSKGQVFPIGENCFKNIKLQRQQGNTCTLTTRYEAGGNGSYIIERELNAQEEIKVPSAIASGYEEAGEGVAQTLDTHCHQAVIGDYRNDEGYRERKDGDSPTLTAGNRANSTGSVTVPIVNKIRRLTPIECERLQGFPDNWTLAEDNSDTQRYKMIGNAVTVDVVKAVGERIIKTLY